MDLRDLRAADRYVANERLVGSFGAASVVVIDLSDQGAQIEHPQPLRLALRGRFWFRRGDISVSSQAIVMWSHLSQRPNSEGKLLYRTGLRIEEEIDGYYTALQRLVEQQIVHRDLEALNKKRKAAEDKLKSTRPAMKMLRTEVEIPPDQVLLIQHARERLRMHPEEALKWYNRAKFALLEDGAAGAESVHHREDVLAVWEYLERSVDIATIVRVFEKK